MDFLARPPLLRGRGEFEKSDASHETGGNSYEESGGFEDGLSYGEENMGNSETMAMFKVGLDEKA